MLCPLHAAAEETAAQRDRLLEALKKIVDISDKDYRPRVAGLRNVISYCAHEAKAAITAAQPAQQEDKP